MGIWILNWNFGKVKIYWSNLLFCMSRSTIVEMMKKLLISLVIYLDVFVMNGEAVCDQFYSFAGCHLLGTSKCLFLLLHVVDGILCCRDTEEGANTVHCLIPCLWESTVEIIRFFLLRTVECPTRINKNILAERIVATFQQGWSWITRPSMVGERLWLFILTREIFTLGVITTKQQSIWTIWKGFLVQLQVTNFFKKDYCIARNFRQEFNFVAFVRAIFWLN